jgi:hypothetical protein
MKDMFLVNGPSESLNRKSHLLIYCHSERHEPKQRKSSLEAAEMLEMKENH